MEKSTMTPEDVKAIRRGIDVAERQLAEIDARISELKTLVEQRVNLQLYINQAKSLLGESAPSVASILQSSALDSLRELQDDIGRRLAGEKPLQGDGGGPLWRETAWVLARAQRPLTVPEIVELMKADGKSLTAENVIEVVRVAMNRKPEIFETVSRGRYALKIWPADWKTREREDSAPTAGSLFRSIVKAATIRETAVP